MLEAIVLICHGSRGLLYCRYAIKSMSVAGTGHIKRLKERMEFLDERIGQSDTPLSYDIKEAAALRWILQQVDNDERNITYRRAYANGQKNILEFYKKTLEKAVHSGNVEALQFLLDRTNDWLEKVDSSKG